eukprot:4592192-Pleurochrysis_carterae.AAC.1
MKTAGRPSSFATSHALTPCFASCQPRRRALGLHHEQARDAGVRRAPRPPFRQLCTPRRARA